VSRHTGSSHPADLLYGPARPFPGVGPAPPCFLVLLHYDYGARQQLRTGKALRADRFGYKAANLCLIPALAQETPPGFAISVALVGRVAVGRATPADYALIEEAYWGLLSESGTDSVIVRASSALEDRYTTSFAGLFKTVHNVCGVEDLFGAIRDIYGTAHSTQAALYAELRDVSLPPAHLAVLVQEEISAPRWALVRVAKDDTLVELYEEELANQIQGTHGPASVYTFSDRGASRLLAGQVVPSSPLKSIADVIRSVSSWMAASKHREVASLEVALTDDAHQILQLDFLLDGNPFQVPGSFRADSPLLGTPLDKDGAHLGLKGAAMKYFGQAHLFELPLAIFPPKSAVTLSELASHGISAEGHPVTVRFSHGGDLGLPRAFFANAIELLTWVALHRQSTWSVIVHSYIDVAHSFESLIDARSILVEHVPGMWESDNKLDPDVFLALHSDVSVWRVVTPRSAHFVAPHTRKRVSVMTQPLERATISDWLSITLPMLDRVRRDFRSALPLNVHFVQDSNGRICFLNIRHGVSVVIPRGEPATVMHVITTPDDLSTWDGKTSLLLRFTTDRGREGQILEIADRLPKPYADPIFVDFGLLSHPATILRELGFNLIPTYSYAQAQRATLPAQYETYSCSLDRADDPIKRIMSEQPLYAANGVRIVPDADPISPGHLLLVPEAPVSSIAEVLKWSTLQEILRSLPPEFSKLDYILLERGRASFCTSGFTGSHAHAHLVPARDFRSDTLRRIARAVQAEEQPSAVEALRKASSSRGEYFLLIGPDGVSFYADASAWERPPAKRLIRHALRDALATPHVVM
jgi:diadenosine tetraphosphate (Ap4A) HIT family hydrolase